LLNLYRRKIYLKDLENKLRETINDFLNSKRNIGLNLSNLIEKIRHEDISASERLKIKQQKLKNLFNEEYNDSVLYITTGDNINLGRKIATFDRPTGTFTFTNSFPYPVKSGIQYRIDNSPSQRIISGKNNPTTGTIYCTDFSAPNNLTNAISIDFSNTRLNNEHLLPNEVVYLWFERTVLESLENENNRVILTSSYKNVI
jgi:hypothetical protein